MASDRPDECAQPAASAPNAGTSNAQLYYGTQAFEAPIFKERKVIDEIKMSMSAFDCMLPDNHGTYCSGDITTGKRFYFEVLKKHEVHSEQQLRAKLGDEEFSRVQTALIQANVARGVEFAEKLRKGGLRNVVTPGPYFAKGFDQQHYLYLWEWFIIKKACEVRFNCDWEYSNGCTFEYAVAARKGIPRLDHAGNSLELKPAIEKVQVAVKALKNEGFETTKLEQYLEYLRSI